MTINYIVLTLLLVASVGPFLWKVANSFMDKLREANTKLSSIDNKLAGMDTKLQKILEKESVVIRNIEVAASNAGKILAEQLSDAAPEPVPVPAVALLSANEVAAYWGISPQTVFKLSKDGILLPYNEPYCGGWRGEGKALYRTLDVLSAEERILAGVSGPRGSRLRSKIKLARAKKGTSEETAHS